MGLFDDAFFVSMVALSVPILWATLGELISERAGVLNIGIEGMVIVGAFCAFYVGWATDSAWLGVLAAIGGGLLTAAVMAFLSVNARANQIIVGLGLFIVGGGVTAFAFAQLFTDKEQTVAPHLGRIEIPVLSDIPLLGKALFDQGPLVYLAYFAVPLVYFLLWRTKWGLVVRASGEAPEAVEASGSSVSLARWTAVLCAGVGGGLAGAALTVGALGVFSNGVSGGSGFLAIAAVLFGRWKPLGALGACLVFGGAEALQLRLQSTGGVPAEVWILFGLAGIAIVAWPLLRGSTLSSGRLAAAVGVALAAAILAIVNPSISLPAQFWLMFPYVLVLLVLAGLVGRSRVPTALGQPYGGEAATA
jgi:simple sugar transport system permease protein